MNVHYVHIFIWTCNKAAVLTEKNSIVAQYTRAHLKLKNTVQNTRKILNNVSSVKGKPCRFSSTVYTNTNTERERETRPLQYIYIDILKINTYSRRATKQNNFKHGQQWNKKTRSKRSIRVKNKNGNGCTREPLHRIKHAKNNRISR